MVMVLWFVWYLMENHGENGGRMVLFMCLPIKVRRTYVLDRKGLAFGLRPIVKTI
jgi:hypothetical protein